LLNAGGASFFALFVADRLANPLVASLLSLFKHSSVRTRLATAALAQTIDHLVSKRGEIAAARYALDKCGISSRQGAAC
jgi:hypothetical protein